MEENIALAPLIEDFTDEMYCWILDPGSSPQSKKFLLSKLIQEQRMTYAVNTGSANNIELTLKSPLTSYIEGTLLTFKATATNTGSVTLNVDSLGIKNILNRGGTPLIVGDIPSGSLNIVQYDGVSFQLLVSLGGSGTSGSGSAVHNIDGDPHVIDYATIDYFTITLDNNLGALSFDNLPLRRKVKLKVIQNGGYAIGSFTDCYTGDGVPPDYGTAAAEVSLFEIELIAANEILIQGISNYKEIV